ncbi:putative Zn(II)2Cys6 transcription factor [Amylocarpus encephaloides]|uniref:Zn(II)2Cys6 transcription factor n=1 Tax=Amylocarpus encephaloides TaxID=45428 RepID=A0A9P7YHV4_9HELO|nr:putative Zn(II)2Cys6 transcription factor [Amylocarpus encephaloides]
MRRTHRKSRNGCAECKRRHMKCDENQPICAQCTISRRPCSYSTASTIPPQSPSLNYTPLTPGPSHAGEPPGVSSSYSPARQETFRPSVSSLDILVGNPSFPSTASGVHQDNHIHADPSDPFAVNMLHLRLMQQFSMETGRTFLLVPDDAEASTKIFLKAGLQHSFLMQEILAIAALHLGFSLPGKREYYHHQATGLQARALSIFNSTSLDVGPENCVAITLFSSLFAMHSLCDAVESCEKSSDKFLSACINSLDMHRGSRTITQHSWHLLLQTEIRPILHAEHLQTAFDQEHTTGGRTNACISWPAMVQSEYMDLLMKRNPEALVILTRYGVLLHCHRELWCIASAGEYLIKSIDRHLGSYWESWLVWPNEVIGTSLDYQS